MKNNVKLVIALIIISLIAIFHFAITQQVSTRIYKKNTEEMLRLYVRTYGDSLYNCVTEDQIEVHIIYQSTHYENIDIEKETIDYILALYIVRYGPRLYNFIKDKKDADKNSY